MFQEKENNNIAIRGKIASLGEEKLLKIPKLVWNPSKGLSQKTDPLVGYDSKSSMIPCVYGYWPIFIVRKPNEMQFGIMTNRAKQTV